MDEETFKMIYGGIKAYVMFLIDCFQKKSKKDDFILEKDYFYLAKFSLCNCILLNIKEELLENTKDSFICKTLDAGILNAVYSMADITKDGFIIDGYTFSNPESVVGKIRNKLAHGEFKIDIKRRKVLFNMDDKFIGIKMEKVINMIIASLYYYYMNVCNNEYKRNIVINNKVTNRISPLKTKSETKSFLNNYRKISFSLNKKDGTEPDEFVIKKVDEIITYYQNTLDVKILHKMKQDLEKNGYNFNWKQETINESILENTENEILNVFPKDMTFNEQYIFINKSILKKIDPKRQLIDSFLKNISILDIAYKLQTKNYENILKVVYKVYDHETIGYEELAAASFGLFESLFSYGNDKLLENKNEYTFLPNTGLDYSKLDLSCINVLYTDKENKEKNSLLLEIISKKKRIKELDAKMDNNKVSLTNVLNKNNMIAYQKISSIIANLNNARKILYQELNTLNTRLNEIMLYESNYENHLKNKNIVNAIRNSISHGNYKIERINNENKIVFEDIYEGKLTFKCEVNVVEFINMIFKNESIIIDFINNKETLKKTL